MMFKFSTSEVGLVKYPYDEQLALILAFLVRSSVSETATLDTTSQTSQSKIQYVSVITKAVVVFVHV